jgi:alanyl-tRNA synthetase
MVFAKLLNLKDQWLEKLIEVVIAEYEVAYPELRERGSKFTEVMIAEQNKFGKTLEKGLREFEKLFAAQERVSGTDAFNLYQTFGFPLELTKELAEAAGQTVGQDEFEQEFKKHQDLSRTASAGEFKGGLANTSPEVVRYHTTTHLLHQALRTVLGNDVWQKGSNITADRTRFDFTYPDKLTDEQKKKVEDLVNEWIQRDAVVTQEMMPLTRARELGAIGLFGEKYADTVSVYTITDPKTGEVISREFCGGPHVEHTAIINGHFKIKKEEAVSAGVRRIKGILQ